MQWLVKERVLWGQCGPYNICVATAIALAVHWLWQQSATAHGEKWFQTCSVNVLQRFPQVHLHHVNLCQSYIVSNGLFLDTLNSYGVFHDMSFPNALYISDKIRLYRKWFLVTSPSNGYFHTHTQGPQSHASGRCHGEASQECLAGAVEIRQNNKRTWGWQDYELAGQDFEDPFKFILTFQLALHLQCICWHSCNAADKPNQDPYSDSTC